MPLALNDIVLVAFRGTCLNQRILFTQFYRVSQPASGSITVVQDLQGIAAAQDGTSDQPLLYNYLGCMANNYVCNAVRVQRVYPTRSVAIDVTRSLTGANTETTDATNLAGVVTLRTAKAGRSQVSNKHIGPLPGGSFTQGNLRPSYQTDLGDLGNAIISPLVTTGFSTLTPIIYHRGGDGPSAKYDDMISMLVQTTVRTERRRTLRVGE